jgi:DNA-binding NtrC family response regulator
MAYSILLVDDDVNLLSGLRRALRHHDWTIEVATSGEEALRLLAYSTPDVIVSDLRMPGMDGLALLEQAASLAPGSARFMLTGDPSLEVTLAAINRSEVTRFFVKPCDPTILGAAIRQVIGERAVLRAARRLLARVLAQDRILQEIETTHPGLTRSRSARNAPADYVPSEAPLDLAGDMERACHDTVKIVRPDGEAAS